MTITKPQVEHFHEKGFIFLPNPVSPEQMRQLAHGEQTLHEKWAATTFPTGINRMTALFLMLGEPALELMEQQPFLDAARSVLNSDDVYLNACGMGNAQELDGKPGHPAQVYWHSDGYPDRPTVGFRVALDRHDASTGVLRILPGSHRRPREEVREELMQLELATGCHSAPPQWLYARHPDEVELTMDPRWVLVWNSSTWHATGPNVCAAPRRSINWNYVAQPDERYRTWAMYDHLYPQEQENWPEQRRRLWALDHHLSAARRAANEKPAPQPAMM